MSDRTERKAAKAAKRMEVRARALADGTAPPPPTSPPTIDKPRKRIPSPGLPDRPGPDVINIGLAKAGTGWLFDQLQFHPDFWMPPVKEMHYLDRESPRMRAAAERLVRMREIREAHRKGEALEVERWRGRGSVRDIRFLEEVTEISGEPRDIDRYIRLFRYKHGLLSGDITPGYAELETDVIREVAQNLPETKIVLLIRDPVEREWSLICMLKRSGNKGGFAPEILEDPIVFRAYLEARKARGTMGASSVYTRWKEHAPDMDLRVWALEDIATDGEKIRREVVAFVGGDPEKGANVEPDYNRKADREKMELPDSGREVLIDYLRDEIKACAELFGGYALEWAAKYAV